MFAPRPRVVRRRPLLRAAAIGGTYAAGRAMGQRAQERAYAEQEQDTRVSSPESGQAAGQYQAQPGGQNPSVLDQLNQLTALHQEGALSDQEFAAAKAQVLGGST
jgi:hypothetical protein